MKNRTKVYKALSLIVALMVCLFTVGYAFAWLIDRKDVSFNISGNSAGAYFDSGDGLTEETAFVIANSTHMRNLAALQNTGKFVDASGKPKKYYFEIKKTVKVINMQGKYMPPIGNDKFPFIGDFNGNGKTLANITVTTNKNLLKTDYPIQSSKEYLFSQSVGLFGKTGSDSNIHNVILENPTVNVASVSVAAINNATDDKVYNTDGENASPKKAVGLAVGHVAGKCQSIGVRAVTAAATSLDVDVVGYSTFNSILGELGDGVSSSVTGGGHTSGTGGSGAAFGSSFDVDTMLSRLEKIKTNKASGNASFLLPDIDSSNDYPVPQSYAKMPFTVDTEKSVYEGSNAKEVVSDQNVGYFLGNQNKFTSKRLSFGKRLPAQTGWTDWTDENGKTPAQSGAVPMWFYTNTNTYVEPVEGATGLDYNTENTVYKSAAGFNEITQEQYDELPDGIKNLLPEAVGQKSFTPIRISQTYKNNGAQNFGNDSNEQWSYHGQISYQGKTYGKGFRGPDGLPVDENGNVLTDCNDQYNNQKTFNAYYNGIALPNCAIWFKPAQIGKFRFVMYADKAGEGFTLLQYTRLNADKDNPFKVDPSKNGDDFSVKEIIKCKIPSDVLFYYEYDVSQEELDAGNIEYVLMQYGNGGAYFMYMDLGASAAADTSGVDREKAVSAVDFIYEEVEIKQGTAGNDGASSGDSVINVGDFIIKTSGTEELYESSKTSVYFDQLKAALKVVYVRLHGQTSGKYSGKTITIEGTDPEPNKDSEVYATYATYVYPEISGGSGTVSGGGGGGTEDPDPPTPDDVKVTSVTLNKTTLSLSAGGSETLTATVAPDNATNSSINWSTSDSEVATVANGVVTAGTRAGTATITATAADGSGKSATCTVTVTAASVPVTNISIDSTTVKAGETLNLTATVEPENATDKTVEWTIKSYSSGVLASFSDTGLYIDPNSAGGTVTLTANAGSFTKDFEITVTTGTVDPTPTSQSIVFANDTEASTKYASINANAVIDDNDLFTVKANVAYSHKSVSNKGNQVTLIDGTTKVYISNGSLMTSDGIAKDSTVEVLTITAKQAVDLKLYLAISNNNWGTAVNGVVKYKIKKSGETEYTEVATTVNLTNRETGILNVTLQKGDEIIVSVTNSDTKNTRYVYFGGAEAKVSANS